MIVTVATLLLLAGCSVDLETNVGSNTEDESVEEAVQTTDVAGDSNVDAAKDDEAITDLEQEQEEESPVTWGSRYVDENEIDDDYLLPNVIENMNRWSSYAVNINYYWTNMYESGPDNWGYEDALYYDRGAQMYHINRKQTNDDWSIEQFLLEDGSELSKHSNTDVWMYENQFTEEATMDYAARTAYVLNEALQVSEASYYAMDSDGSYDAYITVTDAQVINDIVPLYGKLSDDEVLSVNFILYISSGQLLMTEVLITYSSENGEEYSDMIDEFYMDVDSIDPIVVPSDAIEEANDFDISDFAG